MTRKAKLDRLYAASKEAAEAKNWKLASLLMQLHDHRAMADSNDSAESSGLSTAYQKLVAENDETRTAIERMLKRFDRKFGA